MNEDKNQNESIDADNSKMSADKNDIFDEDKLGFEDDSELEFIDEPEKLLELKNNVFKGAVPQMTNSQITFSGKNNMLYCEKNVKLENCFINFNCDNSLVYLSNSKYTYYVAISVHYNSVVYIGRNNYMKSTMRLIASEGKNIVIGSDGLFSEAVVMRVADPHLIYSVDEKTRLNPSKSVYVGDHVWIGQNVLIFKGTKIGSGSIIGGGSVVPNKIIPSNTSYAGNPAKMVAKGVFFLKDSVHRYQKEDTQLSKECESDDFIYENIREEKLVIGEIERSFRKIKNLNKKLSYIKETISKNKNKNRLQIAMPVVKVVKPRFRDKIRAFIRRLLGI